MTAPRPAHAMITQPLLESPRELPLGAVVPAAIGHYALGHMLGAGGTGVVYAAEHTLLGRPAAVKLLHPDVARDPVYLQRLRNEAMVAAAIDDPQVVTIYDFGVVAPGDAFLAMERLTGETLRARLHRNQVLHVDAALAIARQVATALAAVHRRGVVHRDVTPDNIFITPHPDLGASERIKLIDFGCARFESTLPGPSEVVGTPGYMAPEQGAAGARVDARGDLYSLGCAMFHMLTGRLPFAGPVGWVLNAHRHLPVPPLTLLAPNVPPVVAELVAALLAKRPEERPSSAEAVAATLRGIQLRRHVPPVVATARARRRPRTWNGALAARRPGPARSWDS